MICGAVNIAVVKRGSITDRNWRKPSARHDDNYIHRPTAVTYMVAAGRFLVGRESLLHQFKGNHLAELGKIEVKHMANKATHVTADSGD